MKKSFDETIQWMREQNWIKDWLKSVNLPSLDDVEAQRLIKSRYEVMDIRLPRTSIVLGVRSCRFENAHGAEYAQQIRADMHKWMFDY